MAQLNPSDEAHIMELTQDELRKIRAELEEWLPPSDFTKKVEALDQQIFSDKRFSSQDFKFLRDDACVLAQFAQLIGAGRVRLVSQETERFPDGYVKVSGQCLAVEITEADRPDRKRGNEYKRDAPTLTYEQINDAEQVARVLDRALQRKVEQNYALPGPTLVVNLNLGVHGNQKQEEKLASLVAVIKDRYKSKFSGIYVLRAGRLL
jgi:hypothetical protein